MRWRVILPIKPQGLAKTRLRQATPSDAQHAELVRAIQLDTLAAVLAARTPDTQILNHPSERNGHADGAQIVGVHVVGDSEVIGDQLPDVHLIPDPGSGLNPALSHAAATLMRQWPDDSLVAMVADLPSLRPDELRHVLSRAALVDRGVVVDAAGAGTTMLTVRAGVLLRPEFGLDSAVRHQAAGAAWLPAGAGARTDVDTAADLQRCLQLGVGEHTARIVAYLR